jgi:hypothetical protein
MVVVQALAKNEIGPSHYLELLHFLPGELIRDVEDCLETD